MKLQKIKSLAQQIIHEIDSSEGKPFENFRIRIEGGQIICTWDANTTGEMDILYYAETVHSLWRFSVRNKGFDLRIEDEEFNISIGREAVWHVKAIAGDHDEEKTDSNIPEEETEEPTEITDMLWGWWYDEQGDDRNSANVIKVWADDIRDALRTEYKVIPFIGEGGSLDHNSSLNDFRKRYENKGRYLSGVSPDKVPVVILGDEPDAFPVDMLEDLIDLAREVINPDLEYTFSFRRTNIHPNRDVLPQNTSVIWWNHYPFRGEDYPNPYIYVHDRETFFESSNKTLRIARELAPNAKFIISTQTFSQYRPRPKTGGESDESDWQFRTPHPESPQWYAEWITQNDDLIGGLHFVYSGNYAKTAVDMPDLLKNIEHVKEQL